MYETRKKKHKLTKLDTAPRCRLVKWSMCLYDIDKITMPTGMAYNIGLAGCWSFSQTNPKVVVVNNQERS